MYVEVTKAMVKALNKELKNRDSSIDRFIYDKMDFDSYVIQCGEFKAFQNDNTDFNPMTNSFKLIRVRYNDDCYAFDNYITTYDLNKAFKASDKTYPGFMDKVFDNYEI